MHTQNQSLMAVAYGNMMTPYGLGAGSSSSLAPVQKPPETDEQMKTRFQVELEFVQCLANPHYLNFLAQRDFFKQETFINYLSYLMYWKRPEYAKFLKYPQCLHLLELLQNSEFRDAMARQENAVFCEEQQLLQWQFYIRKRARLQFIQQLNAVEQPDK